jgi:dTMP kinase
MKTGKLITIMGITNLGKTTQQNILEERLKKEGYNIVSFKYPMYTHEPTGPRIFDYLKKGNPENLSPTEFQKLNVQNRKDFEPVVKEFLQQGYLVLAEMYVGTGIAYGMGDGIPKSDLIEWNKELLQPDISILLDGNRFMESKESGHIFEEDDEKTENIRKIHLELAQDFDWDIVNANQSIEKVHQDIWNIILKTSRV